ncbi:hypothetical protein [Mycetocola spongiae]|uniref:hypothetical protein n=1 Tax=Mycetocola spongiae TaxID=2859226 RepID=UPI001CF187A0|nr:hypothetical protein [Mycetocola spongiae]UCR89242.1 hypothetical protein KXZ72_00570 [Mycetocola spongiae]
MRAHEPELIEALKSSFNYRLLADVFHGTDPVMRDVQLTQWTYKWSLGAEIKSSGSATVVYQSVEGESLRPVGTKGTLSPFRARLLLSFEVSVGAVVHRIPMGWARITSTPKAYDVMETVGGVSRVITSVVPIVWQGLEIDLRRRGFHFPEPAGRRCWDELLRISGFPVAKNVADKPIPAATVWDAVAGGRLAAVQKLGDLLGGRVVVTPAGELTVAPSAISEPVAALHTGPNGTITDLEDDIDTESVYTSVVGLYETEDRQPIISIAQHTVGDLAVGGLFPEYVKYHTSDMVKDQGSADKATQAVLEQTIGALTYKVSVQCIVNPLVEINDFVRVTGPDRAIVGRITDISLSDSPLMNLVLEVGRGVS